MKKWIAVVTVVVVIGLMPAVALAHHGTGSHDDGDGSGGAGGITNTNTATGGAGGSGTGSNSGINYGTQNTGNINSNSATGGAGGSATQGQKQKQGQAQGQGQSQSSKQNTSVDASQDSPRQAPPAFAPNLVAAPETCMGSTAIGASTPFGGVAIGTTYKSDDCELRMFARSLSALGQNEAALALLAQNPKVAAALRTVGAKLSWLQEDSPTAAVVAVTPPSRVLQSP